MTTPPADAIRTIILGYKYDYNGCVTEYGTQQMNLALSELQALVEALETKDARIAELETIISTKGATR